ncbi:MAG TPA: DUF1194 domain-containing protein [Geminicoccus sp.]|jgi:hypothetical protein|uniref:DUF1194 domain-containing protein n=1 Tax=Geminicoccus sp. TaxID=2024832 RepID=UPI002E320F59|nr:DUF1194 domain-containing protein [Geminicoccus sp.]HEX2526542.1 DUF1194 domain-containing protein [Geminicoccus sp.]
MARLSWIVGYLSAALAVLPAKAEDVPVDLELILAVDVSGSMDYEEQRLQRAGYLDALAHEQVLNAILSGPNQRIALTYVEWAGVAAQSVAVPWRLIDGPAAAEQFAAELAKAPFSRIRHTSISAALLFTSGLFAANGFSADRQVIDISGDGPNNAGPPVLPVRDELADQGIIVNGLPIMLKDSNLNTVTGFDLDVYYEDCVITGPGAFVVPVETLENFGEAIRQKLTLEIAANQPKLYRAAARASRIDCGIGERLRQNWYRDP